MAWAAARLPPAVALAAVFGLAAVVALSGAPAAAERLTGACLHFPPGKIEGQPVRPGFEVEIMAAALAVAGDSVELSFYPWARALALTEEGQVDLLRGCSQDPGRQDTLLQSDPIGRLSVGLFALARPDGAGLPGPADLAGREVGVVAGYNLVGDLRAAGATPIAVDSDAAGLRMLAGARFPLFYGFADSVRFTVNEQRMSVALDFRELRAETNHVCFSRRAGDAAARAARFNQGLAAIRADGRLSAIRRRYGIED